jgi:site-specific DNA recombinase
LTRTALYARYSSDMQSQTSIDDQFAICRDQATREGWRIIGSYQDAAISGASVILRPGIQSLLQDAQLGKFDTILAEALDRISRDQADVATLYKHFQFAGVKLVTIAEGEISELHVGLKGTMNALFLKDLAKKTHRGLRGRVEKGKSGGGLCYGYSVLKRVDASGELVRGERSINEAEALVVQRIFREFSNGKSPRAIAWDLNRDDVPGPFGKQWSDTTIRGHAARKTGILHNELYVGVLVWNRQRFIKNPSTGKRVSRPNPESEWIKKDVPELRILTDELWQAVRQRADEIGERYKAVADGIRVSKGKRLRDLHRPVFLFSGMIECGVCGGNCTIIVNDRYGCNNHFRKGTCGNNRTIRREVLEKRALHGISERLVSADAVKQAVASYIEQINSANREQRAQAELDRRSLDKVERAIAGILSAIEDGMYQPSMKTRLSDLEQQRDELRHRHVEHSVAVPDIHPNVAELYRRRVAYLIEALKDPALRDEVAQDIRSIVGKIIISPGPDRGQVYAELCGQLMGILNAVSKEGGGGGQLYQRGLRPPATNVGITPGYKVIPTGEASPRNHRQHISEDCYTDGASGPRNQRYHNSPISKEMGLLCVCSPDGETSLQIEG